jgi:hypothetical protein
VTHLDALYRHYHHCSERRRAYSVYAADVDGDGRVDVLSASQTDDKIAWYNLKSRGCTLAQAAGSFDNGTACAL